jgi:hypothetical protein
MTLFERLGPAEVYTNLFVIFNSDGPLQIYMHTPHRLTHTKHSLHDRNHNVGYQEQTTPQHQQDGQRRFLYSLHHTRHDHHKRIDRLHCILAVARVALAVGTAAATMASLDGLGGLLKLRLGRPSAEDDDGGLHGGAPLLFQVRVHLAAIGKIKLIRAVNYSAET